MASQLVPTPVDTAVGETWLLMLPSPSSPNMLKPAGTQPFRAGASAAAASTSPGPAAGTAGWPLTPAVGRAAGSQSARVESAGRDREPAGAHADGHRCGYELVVRGAVTQLAVLVVACENAGVLSNGKRRSS
jgi:hypothetical protein